MLITRSLLRFALGGDFLVFNINSAFMKRFHLISDGELLHTFDSVVEFLHEYLFLRSYLESSGQSVDLDWVIT